MTASPDRGPTANHDRMESEVATWLRGLEPTGTPPAVRLRTTIDLHDAAARRRPMFVWIKPTLSVSASLIALAFCVGLFTLLVLAANANSGHTVGGPAPTAIATPVPTDQNGIQITTLDGTGTLVFTPPNQNPIALIVLIGLAALAGASLLLRRTRRIAYRIAILAGDAEPFPLLPFKRPLRSVSRLTWLMGAVALATAIWVVLTLKMINVSPVDYAVAMYPSLIALPFGFVVALRYSMGDRAAKLLLISVVASLISEVLFLGQMTGAPWVAPWGQALPYALAVLSVAASVTQAGGLAGLSRSVRPPPLWLAVCAVGAAFLVSNCSFFFVWFESGTYFRTPLDLTATIANGVSNWAGATASLAILWIAITAWRRRGGRWGWRIMLVSGVFAAASWLLFAAAAADSTGLLGGSSWVVGGSIGNAGPDLTQILYQWQQGAGNVGITAYLIAILIGLRPVLPPATGLEPDAEPKPDEPSRGGLLAGASRSGEVSVVEVP